jgi:hypothetical protein
VQRDGDEDAWRAIVENYGERVELDDEAPAEWPSEPGGPGATQSNSGGLQRLFRPLPEPQPEGQGDVDGDPDGDLDDDELDRFVPPTPPPLPRLPPDRLLAWAGLFGSPSLLLVFLVFDVGLPSWLGYLLVASFVGGFGYLVATMPRGSDIDPWDDGARL